MIFISKNGEQHGPFSEEQIKLKLLSREYTLDDFAWREGLAEWQRIFELLGIHPPPVSTAISSSPQSSTDLVEPPATVLAIPAQPPSPREIRHDPRATEKNDPAFRRRQKVRYGCGGCGGCLLIAIVITTVIALACAPYPPIQRQPRDRAEIEKKGGLAANVAVIAYLHQAEDFNRNAEVYQSKALSMGGWNYQVTMYANDVTAEGNYRPQLAVWKGHVAREGSDGSIEFDQDDLTINNVSFEDVIAAVGANTPHIDKPNDHRH